jgi:secreted trypsin-like serine protease
MLQFSRSFLQKGKMSLKFCLGVICLIAAVQCFDGKSLEDFRYFSTSTFNSFRSDFAFVPDFVDNEKVPKIVGGSDAYIEDVRYQVSLRRLVQNETYASWGHTCGAFIISTDAIITAAHCIYGRESSKFQIRAGSDLRSQGGQIVNVTKFFLHPDYQPNGFYNDIAVMKLQKRLQFNSKVWSIALPAKGYKVPNGAPL